MNYLIPNKQYKANVKGKRDKVLESNVKLIKPLVEKDDMEIKNRANEIKRKLYPTKKSIGNDEAQSVEEYIKESRKGPKVKPLLTLSESEELEKDNIFVPDETDLLEISRQKSGIRITYDKSVTQIPLGYRSLEAAQRRISFTCKELFVKQKNNDYEQKALYNKVMQYVKKNYQVEWLEFYDELNSYICELLSIEGPNELYYTLSIPAVKLYYKLKDENDL